MKRINLFLIITIIILAGCNKNSTTLQVQAPVQDKTLTLKNASLNGKYIVILNHDNDIAKSDLQTRGGKIREKAHGLLKKHNVADAIEEVYESALQGFTIKMSPEQAKKVFEESDVKIVEPDQVVSLSPVELNIKHRKIDLHKQITPWGVKRVGGVGRGIDKTAWVIDTGIDLNHPDLNVDHYRSVSFLGGKTTPDDQNGHGTHVAGIIAAKNNKIGVVGVAAGAKVVSVRVLDRQGTGTVSGVIAGINYVAANGEEGDVANLSLEGAASTALDEAVINASSKVKFALAAGNDSDNANNYSPARAEGQNVYTVSAMEKGDKWASFSNYGNPPIDFCAPGVDIYSTYMKGGYEILSGTSMAAPHVAGILLLGNIKTDGTVKNDPDGMPDPIAHR